MELYNQKLDKYSYYWCVEYGIFYIFQLKFWIVVTNSFILKALAYFENLLLRSSITWAVFSTLYKWNEKAINSKLWIKVKVVEKQIKDLKTDDTWTRGFWMIKYHSFKSFISDWDFDNEDIDEFIKYVLKTYKHHLIWDWSGWWYLVNPDWTKPVKCSLETLNYMVKKWLIWSTCRTFEPADPATRVILNTTMMMQKAELKWKLPEYLSTNKDNPYLPKAKELFYYWKK